MKFIYLIQLEGTDICKIGFTKNAPALRLKSLQTGNPYKLILLEQYQTSRATKIEAALHRTYKSKKIDENEYKLQGEFFDLDYKTRKNFLTVCAQFDANFKFLEDTSTLKKPY